MVVMGLLREAGFEYIYGTIRKEHLLGFKKNSSKRVCGTSSILADIPVNMQPVRLTSGTAYLFKFNKLMQ